MELDCPNCFNINEKFVKMYWVKEIAKYKCPVCGVEEDTFWSVDFGDRRKTMKYNGYKYGKNLKRRGE